jgi:microcystin-dependent protein
LTKDGLGAVTLGEFDVGQPFIGEIRMFGGNFPPAGWAFCDGQLMAISENDTLFNLIGTTYGGDGQETFAMPDMRGRAPLHMGTGPGLTQTYQIGENIGVEQVQLSIQQIPVHSHPLLATNQNPAPSPQGAVFGAVNSGPVGSVVYGADVPVTPLSAVNNTTAGGSQPHDNMQPYLGINFIISLFGVYPTQN